MAELPTDYSKCCGSVPRRTWPDSIANQPAAAFCTCLLVLLLLLLLLLTDMKGLQPQEDEVKELRNHVIIAGYGRVGQIIAQMLSELLIPFVALDVRSDR